MLKYDQYGNLKWARTYNGIGAGDDFGIDICIDANDNVYIGGSCTQLNTYFDFLVLKYDRGGNYQWASFYDNLHLFDIANKIEISGSTVVVAGGTQVNVAKWEYAVTHFNVSNGNFIGVKITSSSGVGIDQISDLCIDASGNIYVTGGVVNAGTGYDYQTVKLNDSLDVQWVATYNGDDDLDDIARSVQVDASGNVFVTGYSLTQNEDTNLVTIKYNSSGVEQWTEEFNNDFDGCDKGEALAIDGSGNIYVAATYFNGSNSDYLTLKYNTDGDLQWKMTYNGLYNQNDEAKDICLDDEGDIIVVGQSFVADEYHYITVKYSEIDVIIPPDDEAVSSSLSYIENNGQLLNTSQNPATDVKFYSTGSSPKVYFEDENISFVLSTMTGTPDSTGSGDTIHYHKCEMQFHEADPYIKVRAFDQRDDYFNYFLAHIPKGRARVPNFEKVIYTDLFEDIDLLFSSNNRGWKYYYIIKPGADPENIEFAFSGADSMYVNANDELILATSLGNIVFPQADAYQINSLGNKVSLAWQPGYELDGTTINFYTDSYDTSKPLIFEVKQGNATTGVSSIGNLEWCTYYGGETNDLFLGIKSDSYFHNFWIVGVANSPDFPVLPQNSLEFHGDMVLIKFKYENTIWKNTWVSYLGGSDEEGLYEIKRGKAGIAVDESSFECFISFGTSSSDIDIPTPQGNEFHGDLSNNCRDVFIARFDPDGDYTWGTYFGEEECYNHVSSHALGLDNNNNLYVTGYDRIYTSPNTTARCFIAKFDTGRDLDWEMEYGGNTFTIIKDITFDSNNYMIITGYTKSEDFPNLDPNPQGNTFCEPYTYLNYPFKDAFIAKFANNQPVWASCIGGIKTDYANAVYCDNNNNYYVTGFTNSGDFPVEDFSTPYYDGQCDVTYNSAGVYNGDAFIAKFSDQGVKLFMSYFGGSDSDAGTGTDIIGDNQNNIYVSMTTSSSILDWATPNLDNGYEEDDLSDAQDGFILSFSSNFDLRWTSYFGGYDISGASYPDRPTDMAITSNNKLFMVGNTATTQPSSPTSDDFPIVQSTNDYNQPDNIGGYEDGFIAQFDISTPIGIIENKSYEKSLINMKPNPASNSIWIDSKLELVNYEIYNFAGQLIISNKFNQPIDIRKLKAGIYLLKMSTSNENYCAKFIKE